MHILSTSQFNKSDVEKILLRAKQFEVEHINGTLPQLLSGKIIASVFFEPSTRTRLSFETAVLRLGGQIITVENAAESSSAFKGETIEDTARMLSSYADAIVMRHPKVGSAEAAAKVTTKPILNAGDGANQHPSQGFLDLYTISKEQGRLDNLTIVFVGDLKNSRTLHSLVPLLTEYPNNSFIFVSPKELRVPETLTKELSEKSVTFTETENLDESLKAADVVYMTRVQKERFENKDDYERVKDMFLLKAPHLSLMKETAIIMHPLPRVNEIDTAIDQDSRAAYFRQPQNGLYIRMALLCEALGL
jgi:aspartate carbamoyltransferase catalytic subunit